MSQSPHATIAAAIINNDNNVISNNNVTSNIDNKANAKLRECVGKVVCVGRNYAAHAHELGNEVPSLPLLFIKPASSIVSIHNDIIRPDPSLYGETHYEGELCIQLAADLSKATAEQAKQAIGAITLGLDLTLRELQSQLKAKAHPWERAKCFDGACVLADWLEVTSFGDLTQVSYQLHINNELKQEGNSALMLFPIYELIAESSHAFSLQAGDVIMTGTPSGVGVLQAGDQLQLTLGEHQWQTQVR